MPFIAIGLLIAAALGGGTAVAAQHALPGDVLWGFKVHVNESIGGAMSTSAVAKANWDLQAIQTRLSEAQALAANGSLTANTQTALETNFEDHASGVTHAIAGLEAAGDTKAAADIAAQFQSTMAEHSAILADTEGHAGATIETILSPLLMQVRATLDSASTLSAQANAQL